MDKDSLHLHRTLAFPQPEMVKKRGYRGPYVALEFASHIKTDFCIF
jgi:hypothetical protein